MKGVLAEPAFYSIMNICFIDVMAHRREMVGID
jgi:hypothetical protein